MTLGIKALAEQAGGERVNYAYTEDGEDHHTFTDGVLIEFVRLVREVPEGYQLVPIEPTEAMIDATGVGQSDMRKMIVDDYKAMLEAAKP